MSVTDQPSLAAGGTVRAHRPSVVRRRSAWQWALLTLATLVGLALVRVITNAQDITSAGTLGATITLAMPIALAGLGGLWSERAGVVNIGLEGMMILGTWFGADFAYISHSAWLGIVGGLVGGLIGGLVQAVATVTFGVDQIVSGVAINILALGIGRYLSGVYFTGRSGGGPTQSPQVPTFNSLRWAGADHVLNPIENHHWFLISDVAGLLRGVATSLTWFTILALLLAPLTWFVLWRTAFGLRLRSCGENPDAADSLGVPVYRLKYIAVLVSGMLAGLGGAFLVNFTGIYREGQTGGRGYIGLAAMIFGNWRPGGLVAGSALFGYTDAVQSRQGSTSIHALLLLVAIGLAVGAAYALIRRRPAAAAITAAVAVLVFVWFKATTAIPIELVTYTPQILTLLVLALATQRLRPPAADGIPWRKGEH
jgi:general nucleoside transport system permease protein